jgi:hypothetical protein
MSCGTGFADGGNVAYNEILDEPRVKEIGNIGYVYYIIVICPGFVLPLIFPGTVNWGLQGVI